MPEINEIYLVEVSYSDYDDSWESVIGSFTDKAEAEACAEQYRIAFDPKDVVRPLGWRDLDNVQVHVYPVPVNIVSAPPARIFMAYSPDAPERVRHWSGVVLGVFDVETGEEFFHSVMPNFAPPAEAIKAAVAAPDKVIPYTATAHYITHDGERGQRGKNYRAVADEVNMLLAMDQTILKAALVDPEQ